MRQYFAKDYAGDPFSIFSPPHLTIIAIAVFINIYFFYAARRGANKFDLSIGAVLAMVLLLNEIQKLAPYPRSEVKDQRSDLLSKNGFGLISMAPSIAPISFASVVRRVWSASDK